MAPYLYPMHGGGCAVGKTDIRQMCDSEGGRIVTPRGAGWCIGVWACSTLSVLLHISSQAGPLRVSMPISHASATTQCPIFGANRLIMTCM